ncbi:PRC-barrel domain-containing protein [Flaviflagellibacter deserti]|uniref:PRC-barrel domain-containing protein n=1 Tax=Flaviflagellibacter deserti TaxID=2267266 RepID=A0ABV9Z1P9_9HYPH
MLKQSLAACLLAGAALSPAAAQTSAPANQAAQTGAQQDKVRFVEKLQGQQFRSSDLLGQTVYNLQNEDIGDIGDLVLDRDGQVAAVVIDVGGFLGIGANEVAVPMNALKFEPQAEGTASSDPNSATGRSAASGPEAPASGAGAAGANTQTSARNPAVNQSGTMRSSEAANTSANNANSMMGGNDTLRARIVLSTTRQDLQGAPKFSDDTGGQSGQRQ